MRVPTATERPRRRDGLKNSHDIEVPDEPAFLDIREHDRREIDNPDTHNWLRMMYRDRIFAMVDMVRRYFPDPSGVVVADLGCAQGNTSLILAELGYRVLAVDLVEEFLDYSRLKHERGDIQWIKGNAQGVQLPGDEADVVILGELIEHCAYPEDVIEHALALVKLGGIVVITTPNGSRVMTRLTTFGRLRSRAQRKELEDSQYQPDGDGHLFLFRLKEIGMVLPGNASLREAGYLGSTILLWPRPVAFVVRALPVPLLERLIRLMAKIPILNSRTFCNIYAVIQKSGPGETTAASARPAGAEPSA